MMSPKTDHPAHIRWRSLLRRGRKESASDIASASSMLFSKVFFKYLILLTFDNFPDVKLHVEIWIFAGVAIVYHHHQKKDLKQNSSGYP